MPKEKVLKVNHPTTRDLQPLYNLPLHNQISLRDNLVATRVPSGWLYTTWFNDHNGIMYYTTTFVPER